MFAKRELRVLIAVPSPGIWHADFGMSLCYLLTAFTTYQVGNAERQSAQVLHTQGSILPRMRREALRQATKAGVDYLLFLDSDHTFPRNLLHRLLLSGKDVIGCNCATKAMPSAPTARRKSEETYGALVFSYNRTGLEKVWRLGTGVLLLSRKAFTALGPEVFEMRYKPEVDDYQGEDWTMAECLEKAGFDIWVDHDLSNEVGHVGYFNYRHDMTSFHESYTEIQNGEEGQSDGGSDRVQAEVVS